MVLAMRAMSSASGVVCGGFEREVPEPVAERPHEPGALAARFERAADEHARRGLAVGSGDPHDLERPRGVAVDEVRAARDALAHVGRRRWPARASAVPGRLGPDHDRRRAARDGVGHVVPAARLCAAAHGKELPRLDAARILAHAGDDHAGIAGSRTSPRARVASSPKAWCGAMRPGGGGRHVGGSKKSLTRDPLGSTAPAAGS